MININRNLHCLILVVVGMAWPLEIARADDQLFLSKLEGEWTSSGGPLVKPREAT